MIYVFLDKCLYSPFEFPLYRKKFENNKTKIKLVRHARAANIIMSNHLSILKKYTKLRGKHLLLWTHEPYHNYDQSNKLIIDGKTIHIMNCYTNDVFTHNLRYFYFNTPLEYLTINDEDEHAKMILRSPEGPKIVALSTYYEPKYYEKNPKTILPFRYELILYGYSKGYVDIYGKNWNKYPNVISLGNTRNDNDRRTSKDDILSKYWFNICLENADADYYVTEKIWESIKAGCLPIYYSNNTIYNDFPKNSFIDYRDFKNEYGDYAIQEMYDYIEKMTIKDYKDRMNLCIKTFNTIIQNGKNTSWRGKSDNLNINYLEYETCYQQLLKKISKL